MCSRTITERILILLMRQMSNCIERPANRVRLVSVAASLPPATRTSAEVEARITASSKGFRPRPGLGAGMSGVRTRRVAAGSVQWSALGADAAGKARADAGIGVEDVDLLIFAAAGQDLVEPATANIVQEKLGTRCQAFDVKNACN